jgi:hypothetical protein
MHISWWCVDRTVSKELEKGCSEESINYGRFESALIIFTIEPLEYLLFIT